MHGHMTPIVHRQHCFTCIFFFFIIGLLACNYTRQGDKESESLVRKDIAENAITNEHDGSFLMQCGSSSLKLMEMAKIAQSKSGSDEIKALAAEVLDLHRSLYDEASELALHKSVSLPTVLTESDKFDVDKLSAVAASGFDAAFCELLMREQNYMLEAAKRFSDDARDSDVMAFARAYGGRVNELNDKADKITRSVNS